MNSSGLAPRWASAPGETISSILRERSVAQSEIANRLQMPAPEFDDLLMGRFAITLSLAKSLAEVLGGTSEFWMAREAQYLDDLSRVAAAEWSENFPIKQMAEFGWIEKPRDWHDRISSCLDFFQVDDVAAWDQRYRTQLRSAHYRRSPSFPLDESATAAWFRACENQADAIPEEIATYDSEAFLTVFPAIRKLTRMKDPQRFIPRLVALCASAGVAVVVVRAPSGCPLSGLARWYAQNPLIQLTGRHLTDDHFWFTFFHEASHVLLHDLNTPFFDLLEDEPADEYEKEANGLASLLLTGQREELTAPKSITARTITQMAQRIGISPGLVVGQLQHCGVLANNSLNGLKRRYVWNGLSLEIRHTG